MRQETAPELSPGIMRDLAWMPDLRASKRGGGFAFGAFGPVDPWEFRRLALNCAPVDRVINLMPDARRDVALYYS